MNLIIQYFQNISLSSVIECIIITCVVGGLKTIIHKKHFGKRIGIGKIISKSSKKIAFNNQIANVISSLVLIFYAYQKNNILLVFSFSIFLLLEGITYLPDLKDEINSAILFENGIEINGTFLKFKKADYCCLEGNLFHYFKNEKHHIIEIENENKEKLRNWDIKIEKII